MTSIISPADHTPVSHARAIWAPMLHTHDGRLLLGDFGMTYNEALDRAEVDRARLNSQGVVVLHCGVWNISSRLNASAPALPK